LTADALISDLRKIKYPAKSEMNESENQTFLEATKVTKMALVSSREFELKMSGNKF